MKCSSTCKKISAGVVAGTLLTAGILLVVLWDGVYTGLLNEELTLSNNSKGYKMWKETPIPMYLSLYLYNWTNSKEVLKNWNIKPIFEQCGPYVFLEHHSRVNLQWHDNYTLTYQTKRTWHFEEKMSNGSLDDPITNLNVIAATVANKVKNMGQVIKRAVNIFLNLKEKSLAITHTANEWIFEGFDDEMLDFLQKLNISGINLPFDKFGWFYMRNNSESYDGNYTMYTGRNDMELLGIIEEWNGSPVSPYYDSYCSYVNGTSGELWPPVDKYSRVEVFSSDICSSVALFHVNNTPSVEGIEGKEYMGTDYIFDNGTKYPEMKCFNGEETFPSGVRDVSKCRFGAPAFVSYPHFYMADPHFRNGIEGMRPGDDYTFTVALEPKTGVPLDVKAQLQINIYIQPVSNLSMFENVKKLMIPMLWFKQTATLTPEYAKQVKALLVLPDVGVYTGYGLLSLGILIGLIALYVTWRGAWRNQENEQLLPEKAL